jgi:DNA-binding transcriptional LysR family regulator
MIPDLNLLPLFLAVAEEQSFAAAARRLGITRSAVSQGVQRLENACGIALVVRTTRSVRLTEAGQRLLSMLGRPMAEIGAALENFGGDLRPAGHLKIAVTSIADAFLSGPLLGAFAEAHPDITVDVTVTDEMWDIVSRGFDAGVRLGEVIEKDMVAIPLTGAQCEAVVASPAYLAQHGVPMHPTDLIRHRCIAWRPAPDEVPAPWEFEEKGRNFNVAITPQITTNDLRLMLRMATAGAGLTYAVRETFEPYIASGDLVPVLEAYLKPYPGFYLYFPNRRNMAPKLRALIDHVQRYHRGRSSG